MDSDSLTIKTKDKLLVYKKLVIEKKSKHQSTEEEIYWYRQFTCHIQSVFIFESDTK